MCIHYCTVVIPPTCLHFLLCVVENGKKNVKNNNLMGKEAGHLSHRSVMRLRLGRRLVKILPLAQRTINKTFTNGDDGRTWVVGLEFESLDHHEIAF